MLLLEREMPQEEERRGECQEPEDAVAEDRQGRVELNPGVAAKNVRAKDGVPRGDGQGHNRQRGAKARREVAEEARAEGHPDDQVKRDGRPGRELEDLEAVAEGASAGRVAAYPEPHELEEVS